MGMNPAGTSIKKTQLEVAQKFEKNIPVIELPSPGSGKNVGFDKLSISLRLAQLRKKVPKLDRLSASLRRALEPASLSRSSELWTGRRTNKPCWGIL